MAVFAVGDFPDTQAVVELIKGHFGQKGPASCPPPVIPEFPVPSHIEPRFSCFVESEAAGSAVVVSCKMPAGGIKTVKDYRDSLAESMFHCALNQRLFKISRRKDPPYFSCSSCADALVRPVKAYIMTSSCRERGTVEALESMLLELVYQLFTTKVEPREEEVKIVMQMAEEAIYAQERDPFTAFANCAREINYGNSYFFKPIRINDLKKVDPIGACEYFNNCFKDPSAFTVVIAGNIDLAISVPLILQYLGGIPKVRDAVQPLSCDDLKGLPFKFPETIIREVVRSPMVEAQCFVQLGFPVVLKSTTMMEDIHYAGFLCKLLETKIMQVLRFKYGQIYSVNVGVFLGGNKPSRSGDVCGDISVNFSCDPDMSSKLVDFVLEEISYLQTEGPSEEDVLTILEIEQRAYENGLQENYYWLDQILRSYQSRVYFGDVGSTFEVQDEGRLKVREALTPQAMQLALQRVIPFPCRKQYTVVILMPKSSCWNSLKSLLSWSSGGFSRDAKILAGWLVHWS